MQGNIFEKIKFDKICWKNRKYFSLHCQTYLHRYQVFHVIFIFSPNLYLEPRQLEEFAEAVGSHGLGREDVTAPEDRIASNSLEFPKHKSIHF